MDHETKKKQLQKIEGACDFKFAELKEGQAFGLDGERIPTNTSYRTTCRKWTASTVS